jgi:ATP-dependent DNA helicase DinG
MYIALDLETTGFDPVGDDPIEVAAIRFDEHQVYDTFQTLVNPGKKIPQIVTHITGITDEDVANAPTLDSVKEQIIAFIGDYPIVGHNITFDTTFLKNKGFPLTNPEFDTLPLTSMIYPKLPSYSLETISAAFGIAEKQDHRALSDTVACAQLFQKILGKIKTLSPEILTQLNAVFTENAPHYADLFKNGTPNGTYLEELFLQKPRAELLTSNREQEIEETISSAIEKKETLLLEAGIGNGKYTALTKAIIKHYAKGKEKTLISVSSTNLEENLFHTVFPELLREHNLDGTSIVLVKELQKYLSPARLRRYMDEPQKSFDESCFVAKIYLWSSYTENGEQDELALTGEEFRRWEMVNVNPWRCDMAKEPFLQRAYEREKNASILVCNHRALAKEIMSPTNHLQQIKNLAICEAHLFEKNIINATTKTISLDSLQEKFILPESANQKLEFFFGMLGMLFHKQTQDPGETLIVQEAHKNSKEWSQIRDLYESLVEYLKTNFDTNPGVYGELLEELSLIEGLFTSTGKASSAMLFQNHEEQIRLRYMPIETINTLWNMEFFKELTSRIFISSTMRVAKSFDYIRDRLQIEDTLLDDGRIQHVTEHVVPMNPILAERLQVIIPSSLPDQEKPDYMMHANALMQTLIKKTPGKTIGIFSSKRVLHQSYYALATNLKDSDIQLLSQDFSGGRGKIVEKYIVDPEHMALFGTLAFLEKLELTKLPCENLIFQKIPFDPPSDPIIQMQISRYMDPFMQYALPETILRFLGVLNQFMKNPLASPRNLLVLDSRITKKSYGRTFIDSLPEGMQPIRK